MVRAPATKAQGPGFISQCLPRNVDVMKDLWCYSTVRLHALNTDVNEY